MLLLPRHSKMSKHKCNRDNCETRNVNGPKIKCAKCKNLCFLGCFGISPAEGKSDNDFVKIAFVNGTAVYFPLSQMAFVCCEDSLSTTELKSAIKTKQPRSTSNTRQTKQNEKNEQLFTSELDTIKNMLDQIMHSSNAQSIELNELKSIATDTNAAVKKVTQSSTELSELKSLANETHAAMKKVTESSNEIRELKSIANETNAAVKKVTNSSLEKESVFNTPRLNKMPSFAQAVRNTASNRSSKRARDENANDFIAPKPKLNKKRDVPEVKVGTKTTFTGLSVVKNQKPERTEKPSFPRAVWISRLNPETSNEDIANYIIANTPIKDHANFNVHKLVKKDCDLSTLKFVSFKIQVEMDNFDHLMDPELWPENVMVREFLQDKILGEYFPKLPPPKNQVPLTEKMETSNTAVNILSPSRTTSMISPPPLIVIP